LVSRVNPDPAVVESALVEWLTIPNDHEPAPGWEADPPPEELGCDPALVARLAEVARTIPGARRRFVAGSPVIEHPRGRPIAAAAGTGWLVVRSDLPPGALRVDAPADTALGPEWLELNPWSEAAGFARALDLLRAHLTRAYNLADARP
jgi:hypothetical protein